jgi:glyoxylase-like metal-dependent hydrolase (beta-lactamase superfamily II)
MVTVLAAGLRFVDVNFLGVPSVIATAVMDGPDGVALVDPGPGSCVDTLRSRLADHGVAVADVSAILLTHIHLDHAGATGSLVRENPRITVHVHERGARHMVDPTRLIESASRLYGDEMDRLWGAMIPVPAANVRALAGGERIEAGGRRLEVAYTPGHASHHVSYYDGSSGIAFVGDTAGGRIGGSSYIMPPTPPPDIDVGAWRASAERILGWRPQTLFLTHFGPSPQPPAPHMAELFDRLDRMCVLARAALAEGGSDAEQAVVFQQAMRAELRRHMGEVEASAYELAIPFDHCYLGLARFLRR